MEIQLINTRAWISTDTLPSLSKAQLAAFASERGISVHQTKERLVRAIIRHEEKKAGYESLQGS